jgi:hypothetical protein
LKEVIQIVPRLPPFVSGVGDHALLLAEQLARKYGWMTRFLVPTQDSSPTVGVNGFLVERLDQISARSLETALDRITSPQIPVFLHYVGYGYQKRGCPYWLVQGLRHWQCGRKGSRLVVMFHELFAFGPIWRSSFWLSYFQRYLTGQMARIADQWCDQHE